jgi:hypothetical protein
MTLGNGATEQPSFNDRLQPTGLSITGSGNSNLLTLGFYPCAGAQQTACSNNNGNLQSQSISIPGMSVTQNYTYNGLNQLTGACENTSTCTPGSGSSLWSQSYGYVNGNRYVPPGQSGLPALTSETPIASSWFNSSNRVNT